MPPLLHRTKIVATIGPASSSKSVLEKMVQNGLSVARLNFSHGSYDDHAHMVALLRQVAKAQDTPITLLQDLQGPKIRVGQLPSGAVHLTEHQRIDLVPLAEAENLPGSIGIDYPHLAEECLPGMQVLLDDGLLELIVESVEPPKVCCRVVQAGLLKSRKGVNLPELNLRLPSLTEKDRRDVEFGISQDVDIISLSFVRQAEDVLALKHLLAQHNRSDIAVMAKIEKPQAIENLEAILAACDAVMVARGDLGVEMRTEKVPMLQKRIIRQCNLRSIPVVTATQMLESMIHQPRPTRAEASDVANAIIDGTDAVMLSGESAVGSYPVKAVQMLGRIAIDVEQGLEFVNNPPAQDDATHALSEALNVIDKMLTLRCIVAFTETGYSAMIAAGERPRAPVIAFTPNEGVYHRLNLVWGVRPILIEQSAATFEAMVEQAERYLLDRSWIQTGDKILLMGGIPSGQSQGTNYLKLHIVSGA